LIGWIAEGMNCEMFAALIAPLCASMFFGSGASAQAVFPNQPAVVAPTRDFTTAAVAPGSWRYQAVAGGSEARFVDASEIARLVVQCGRATRRVSISLASSAPAASLLVWTSSASRTLPARFEPSAMRVTADLSAYDTLLDAIAFSRGRIAVTMAGGLPLVTPAWPEAARTIEDCRN
jgi:hypothetical protein